MLCYLLHSSRGRFGASTQPRPAANTTVPVRGNLAGYGPMARNAADPALELEVLAGPNELLEGMGGLQSRIAAAARKVDRFPSAGDQHASALPDRGRHQERAKRARRFVSRSSAGEFSARAPELPDLARTTRAHVELLLAAVYSLEHTGPQIAFQRIVGIEPQLHGDVLHDFGRPGRQPKLRQHPPACVHRRHDRGIQVRS